MSLLRWKITGLGTVGVEKGRKFACRSTAYRTLSRVERAKVNKQVRSRDSIRKLLRPSSNDGVIEIRPGPLLCELFERFRAFVSFWTSVRSAAAVRLYTSDFGACRETKRGRFLSSKRWLINENEL